MHILQTLDIPLLLYVGRTLMKKFILSSSMHRSPSKTLGRSTCRKFYIYSLSRKDFSSWGGGDILVLIGNQKLKNSRIVKDRFIWIQKKSDKSLI